MVRLLLYLATAGIASARSNAGRVERRHLGEVCMGPQEKKLYNVAIELDNISELCNQDDLLNLGEKIKEIAKETDEKVPDYDNESMTTDMCQAPEVEQSRFLRMRDGARRRLGRYATKYLGGGTCRRCLQDNADRRVLQNEKANESNPATQEGAGKEGKNKEAAESYTQQASEQVGSSSENITVESAEATESNHTAQPVSEHVGSDGDVEMENEEAAEKKEVDIDVVCVFADDAEFGADFCTRADDRAALMLEQLTETALECKEGDVIVQAHIDVATEQRGICAQEMELANAAAQIAATQCEEARVAEGSLEGFLIAAEEASQDALRASLSSRDAMLAVKASFVEIKKKAHEHKIALKTAELLETIQELYDAMNSTLAALEPADTEERKEQKASLQKQMSHTEALLRAHHKWEDQMGYAAIAVYGANTQDDWFLRFEELMTLAIPHRLFQEYGSHEGLGCLDMQPNATVTVTGVDNTTEQFGQKECRELF